MFANTPYERRQTEGLSQQSRTVTSVQPLALGPLAHSRQITGFDLRIKTSGNGEVARPPNFVQRRVARYTLSSATPDVNFSYLTIFFVFIFFFFSFSNFYHTKHRVRRDSWGPLEFVTQFTERVCTDKLVQHNIAQTTQRKGVL